MQEVRCPTCEGQRFVDQTTQEDVVGADGRKVRTVFKTKKVLCPHCGGEGWIVEKTRNNS
jgi:DNA-directed RNA polymerase subunit RPC12/RpoP